MIIVDGRDTSVVSIERDEVPSDVRSRLVLGESIDDVAARVARNVDVY